ncbi:hypothetical protein FKM82_025954, partial [Ascaphus truei]
KLRLGPGFSCSSCIDYFLTLSFCRGSYSISRIFSMENKKVFDQQVALVIGSTYGIGLAIARRLAQDGATVLLNSRTQENVDRAVRELTEEGLNVSGTTCHVGNAEDREKLVETVREWEERMKRLNRMKDE